MDLSEFEFPTREDVIAKLSRQSTLYPPGRYFQYSNLSLTLAGEIIAQLSGMPYDAYVKQHILTPLGLNDTFPELPREHRGGRFAMGYGGRRRKGGRETIKFFQARGIAPAAGYASTVEDLAKFASWQFRLIDNGRHRGLESLHAPRDATRTMDGPRLGIDVGPRFFRQAPERQNVRRPRRRLSRLSLRSAAPDERKDRHRPS